LCAPVSVACDVGVDDVADAPHLVLELLPAEGRRQILQDGTVPAGPRGRPAASVPVTAVAAAAAIHGPTPSSAFRLVLAARELSLDRLLANLQVVEPLHRVLGVAHVVKLLQTWSA